ncbi:MAG TPA: hypothetical protein VGN83_22780 [Falsiroseomonas sp.]|jgi:hypothetical protein|nr:hypothetical protein [Falsiroseomonas sp.]
MSKIQNDASRFVRGMLMGDWRSLNREEIHQLNLWIMNLALVCDFTDSDAGDIPAIHRRLLIRRREVGPDWMLFVGRFAHVDLRPHFNKWHGTKVKIGPKNEVIIQTAASFTFTLGNVLIYALIVPDGFIDMRLNVERFSLAHALVPTHPSAAAPFTVPSREVEFDEWSEIATDLPRALGHPFEIPV